jgi:hypothetical protein
VHWFESGKADPNESEILFFAFLLVYSADRAADLHCWATKVAAERENAEQLREQWTPPPLSGPPGGEHGWAMANGVSALYEPMRRAYEGTQWPRPVLDLIGAAMQLWDGPGQHDDLRWQQLRNHLRTGANKTIGIPAKPKGRAPPRWRTWSIVRVADLVKRRGAEMRQLLKLDIDPEQLPPMRERLAEAEAHAAELEAEVARLREQRDLAQNRYRKAAVRCEREVATRKEAVVQ